MVNELSQPQIVSHNCPEHGQRLQAPPTMGVQCRCGRQCEIDVAGWVATQRDQRPDEDIGQLARKVGVPATQARAALEQRD
jgi:hypothetical protein